MEALCPLYRLCREQKLNGDRRQVSLYNQNKNYVETVRQDWRAHDKQAAELLGQKASKDCRGDKLQAKNRFKFGPREDEVILKKIGEPASRFLERLESHEVSGQDLKNMFEEELEERSVLEVYRRIRELGREVHKKSPTQDEFS